MLRRALAAACCAAALLAQPWAAAWAASVTDLAGRSVELPARVERVILGESRMLPVLAILEKGDPTARLVGMQDDLRQVDPQGYAQFRAVAPRLDEIPASAAAAARPFPSSAPSAACRTWRSSAWTAMAPARSPGR
ncbi:hypothetical protein ACFQU7_19775 [Pseudoroseomonas wenyumeiae]